MSGPQVSGKPACRVVQTLQVSVPRAPCAPAEPAMAPAAVGLWGLWSAGARRELAVGVWEHSAGVSADVEADEVFVVLNGSATVEVASQPEPLELRPRSVGFLCAGARTWWTVHEPLRKVYLTG